MPGGYVLPVPAPSEPPAFLLALRRPGVTSAGLAVVQHIATIAALQLTIARHELEMVRREGAEVLAEMLTGVFDEPTSRRRLAHLGFAADRPIQLTILRGNTAKPAGETFLGLLAADRVPHLLLRQEQQILVLLPADETADVVFEEIGTVPVGVSRPFAAGLPLDIPRREATWAVARSEDAGGGLVRYGADIAGRWLAEDSATLRALTADVLGAVATYDRTHRSDLLATVRTWLERDRHTEAVAFALDIHPNTLAYRLRRFEQLSGRDLASTADLAEVWLALRAGQHLDGPR